MVSVDEFDKMMDVATAAQIRLGLPVPFPTKEERIECFKVNRSALYHCTLGGLCKFLDVFLEPFLQIALFYYFSVRYWVRMKLFSSPFLSPPKVQPPKSASSIICL